MNAFNRIVTIIILLILLALLLALAVSPSMRPLDPSIANFSAWLARLQATDPINFNRGPRCCCRLQQLLVLSP